MPAGYNRLFAEREQVDFNITALYFLPWARLSGSSETWNTDFIIDE